MKSNVVLDKEHLQFVLKHFLDQDAFVFDVETAGPHRGVPIANKVVWISLATAGMTAVVPMGHPNGDVMMTKPTRRKDKETNTFVITPATWSPPPKQLRPSQVFDALNPLFFSDRMKGAHNATFDFGSVTKYFDGNIPPPPYDDTIVMSWLLDENSRNGLKDITLAAYKRKYDSENVGRKIEIHPFFKVARYAFMDGKYTWLHRQRMLPQLTEQGLEEVYELEMDVLEVLLHMGQEGTDVDVEQMKILEKELSERVIDTEGRIYKAAGRKFNLNSPRQKVDVLYKPKAEDGQGLKPWRLTRGGLEKQHNNRDVTLYDYSTDAESLEKFSSNKVVAPLLEYQEVFRVLGTYVHGYLGVEGKKKQPGMIFNGRVHPDFVQFGTVTGRFSCVSGDTVIDTSRGSWRIEDYVPEMGDEILTHANRWKPITRKLYKGVHPGVRVETSDGSAIVVTNDHRVRIPSGGWKRAGELVEGDTLVNVEVIRDEPRERPYGTGVVLQRIEAHHSGDGSEGGYDLPERAAHCSDGAVSGEVQSREVVEILPVENGRAQPDVWTEWITPSQLGGGDWRWTRVSTDEGEREVRVRTSSGVGAGVGSRGVATGVRRAPYRHEQAQQHVGQLGLGDPRRTRTYAQREVTVRKITPVESVSAWDLEVAGDHSYAAQGFLNHNCRTPNLQNIPRPDTDLGKSVRSLFIAPPGHRLLVADYGQIEMVLLAHYAGPGALYDGFFEGIDPHTITAARVFGVEPAKVAANMRQAAKGINFAVVYGAGAATVASMAKTSEAEAKRFLATHEREFPEIYVFKDRVVRECKQREKPYIRTLLGRKRRLPTIWASDHKTRGKAERQAVNSLIQGSAADLIKVAMREAHRSLTEDATGRLLLTVHDELVAKAEHEKVELAEKKLREAMLGPVVQNMVRVPLAIDLKVVDRWSEAKDG